MNCKLCENEIGTPIAGWENICFKCARELSGLKRFHLNDIHYWLSLAYTGGNYEMAELFRDMVWSDFG
jgi:hypothetical protein